MTANLATSFTGLKKFLQKTKQEKKSHIDYKKKKFFKTKVLAKKIKKERKEKQIVAYDCQFSNFIA